MYHRLRPNAYLMRPVGWTLRSKLMIAILGLYITICEVKRLDVQPSSRTEKAPNAPTFQASAQAVNGPSTCDLMISNAAPSNRPCDRCTLQRYARPRGPNIEGKDNLSKSAKKGHLDTALPLENRMEYTIELRGVRIRGVVMMPPAQQNFVSNKEEAGIYSAAIARF